MKSLLFEYRVTSKEIELLAHRFLFLFDYSSEITTLKKQGILQAHQEKVTDDLLFIDQNHLLPLEETWLFQAISKIPKQEETGDMQVQVIDDLLQLCQDNLQEKRYLRYHSIAEGSTLFRNYKIFLEMQKDVKQQKRSAKIIEEIGPKK